MMPSQKMIQTKQRSDHQKMAISASTLLRNHDKRRNQLQIVQTVLQKSAAETQESNFKPLILD